MTRIGARRRLPQEEMDGFINPKGVSEMAWNHDRRSFSGGQNFLNVAKNNVIMVGCLMSKFGIVFETVPALGKLP
jgi:hypothetical protein